MRKLLLLPILLLGFNALLNAQTDVSLSPFGLLVPALVFSVEGPIGNDVGLEGYLLAAEGGFGLYANGSYYLNSKRGHDGFKIGFFVGGFTDGGELALVLALGIKPFLKKGCSLMSALAWAVL